MKYCEKKYNLPQKKLLKHGNARLDSIIKNKQEIRAMNGTKHVLFAPSWGRNAAIELGLGSQIIERLLSFGYKVTLRPHPETLKSYSKIINMITSKYLQNKMFIYEENVASLDSFYLSDIMITDWSGAALEYSLGLKKPVLFLDLPKKVNNPKYKDIDLVPLEVFFRESMGNIVSVDKITPELINSLSYKKVDLSKYIFNIGKSDYFGVKYILDLIDDNPNKTC